MTPSVYAARHHHGHRSIEGYQTYGLGGHPLSDQVSSPPVSDQTNGNGNGNNPVGNGNGNNPVGNGNGNNPVGHGNGNNPVGHGNGNNPVGHGNGNNPVGNQVTAPSVNDQANGNGNNPVANQVTAPPVNDQANGNGNREQIQTHTPSTTYKSPSSNDMLMSFARNSTQPLCGAGICSQSSTTQTTTAEPQQNSR
jgi:hypothetical protein